MGSFPCNGNKPSRTSTSHPSNQWSRLERNNGLRVNSTSKTSLVTLENQSIPAEHRLNFLKEKYPADSCNKNSSPHLFWGGISILEEDLWRSCSGQTMVWLQRQMNKSDGHRASPTVSPKHVVVLFAGLSYHMSTGGQLLSEKVFITHDMWYFSVIQVCWLISFFWLKLDHGRHWFFGLISEVRLDGPIIGRPRALAMCNWLGPRWMRIVTGKDYSKFDDFKHWVIVH